MRAKYKYFCFSGIKTNNSFVDTKTEKCVYYKDLKGI